VKGGESPRAGSPFPEKGGQPGRGGARPEPGRGGTEELGYLLARFLRGTTVGRSAALEALGEAWRAVVGPELAAETRVVSFKDGTLRIEVRGSPLLQELSTFYRDSLLAALREKRREVVGLEMRLGIF
jgi:hypothetical protein